MPNPKDLTLKLPDVNNNHDASDNADRRNSSPIALQGIDLSSIEGSFALSSLPPLPASPPPPGMLEPTKNLDHSLLEQSHSNHSKDDDDRPNSSLSKIYHVRQVHGSTPELSLVDNAVKGTTDAPTTSSALSLLLHRPATNNDHLLSLRDSEQSLTRCIDTTTYDKAVQPPANDIDKRKDKSFRNPLARSKSIRKDSHSSSRPNGLSPDPPPQRPPTAPVPGKQAQNMLQVKNKDNKRGKSADRNRTGSDDNMPAVESGRKNAFFTGSKNALNKAKTGSGNFLTRIGKIGRSGSSNEKEWLVPEEPHVVHIINKPLIEQTRITRISKSLDACKDKTEFWMPSLPWRCIDYLNFHCESEGLYRVPGSGPQIKQWQRRFDVELDIDLLDETELYDPNNISSLLKTWLRELPTEIFPMDIQKSLATELAKDNPEYANTGQSAPQKLRDTLSELSPFNYYLLFAITCHLSLLVSHQDKNRMDLHNLFICIGPCLHIDRWAFNYLVGDWRNCWQGCWTEKAALEAERRYEDPDYVGEEQVVISTTTSPDPDKENGATNDHIEPYMVSYLQQQSTEDDRAVSSGGESMLSAPPVFEDALERPNSANSRRLASRGSSKTRS